MERKKGVDFNFLPSPSKSTIIFVSHSHPSKSRKQPFFPPAVTDEQTITTRSTNSNDGGEIQLTSKDQKATSL